MATDQSVIDIVVEANSLAGTCAFHILAEIDLRVIRATNGIIADSPNDVTKLLLLPGPVAWISERSDFFDEIFEAVDFDGGSLADGFQS
jgi:hypothetical protein